MSPAELALLLEGLEEAVKLEPAIQAELVALFSKPNPTPADWTALRVKALTKNYSDYVPESDLPGLNGLPPAPAPLEPFARPLVTVQAPAATVASPQTPQAAANIVAGDDETIVVTH
jgi:hypothetical protein